MADFYDMNAAIRPQNYFASFVQGQQAGRQAQLYQQAQEDRNFFRQMAPQVIAGNPDATAQVAARSPEVAQSYQEAGDSQMRKVKGMVDYFDRARSSGNQAAVQGAWKQISPYLAQITGQQVPELYDEATEGPGLEQLKAQLAGLPASAVSGAVQSTYVDGEGNRVAIMRDGSTQILGRNDAGANQQTLTIDVNGVPTQVTFDRRTGRYSNAVMGGGQPSQSSGPPPAQPPPNVAGGQSQEDFASKSGEDYYQQLIAAGVPDEAATAAVGVYLTNLERRVPSFGGGQPPATQPRPVPQRDPIVFDPINGGIQQPGMPLVGRRKEDEAAAVEAAKIGAQLANAPAVAAAEADAAGRREGAVQMARAEAERAAQAPKREAQYRQALQAAQNVETSIDKALGMIGPMSTGFAGARLRGVEGSPAYNLAAELETVKANLGFDRLQQMRDNSPTGGALGAIAVQELIALQSTIANLDPNQSAEQIKANLDRVKQHYSNWRNAVQQALADEQRGQSQPQAGGWGIQRVN